MSTSFVTFNNFLLHTYYFALSIISWTNILYINYFSKISNAEVMHIHPDKVTKRKCMNNLLVYCFSFSTIPAVMSLGIFNEKNP